MRIALISLLLLVQACASTSNGVTTQSYVGQHPLASASASVLANADFDAIAGAVLRHQDVAMYLHPEVEGRVPVRVVFKPPFDGRPVNLQLYGAQVVTQSYESGYDNAFGLSPSCDATQCTVEVWYKPEGIFGQVMLQKQNGQWQVSKTNILE